jgi:hypothetical protein
MGDVRWKAPFTVAERIKRKKDCMGDVRWMAPFILAERVKRKKDCMGDVRWKSELSQLPNKPLTVSLLIRRKMHPPPLPPPTPP